VLKIPADLRPILCLERLQILQEVKKKKDEEHRNREQFGVHKIPTLELTSGSYSSAEMKLSLTVSNKNPAVVKDRC
jgi:hypothetical protein